MGRYHIAGNHLFPPKYSSDIVFIVFLFFALFRFDVGFDYPSYYSAIYPNPDFFEINRWELIPRHLGLLCVRLEQPQLFFILMGVPTYWLIYSTIKKYSLSIYESFMIFFCIFFLDTTSTLRSSLAVAISFWGIKFIKNKELTKYLLLIFITFFIHKSVIIALPLYFFYNYIDYRISICICILLVILKNIFLQTIATLNFYVGYLQRLDTLAGGNLIKYFNIILVFFLLLFAILFKNINKAKRYFSIIFFGLTYPFIFGNHLGTRLAIYSTIYICLLWPVVMKNRNCNFRALCLFPIYYYFVLLLDYSVKNPTRSAYIPYKLIFFADTTIFRFK
ncbi:EpsG family protein [Treponema sp. HNW]|uniref:EpsG family protein n=1 Tax=Treponema sp. HNW TaxID=3116654 RepID=UPI003D0AF4FA